MIFKYFKNKRIQKVNREWYSKLKKFVSDLLYYCEFRGMGNHRDYLVSSKKSYNKLLSRVKDQIDGDVELVWVDGYMNKKRKDHLHSVLHDDVELISNYQKLQGNRFSASDNERYLKIYNVPNRLKDRFLEKCSVKAEQIKNRLSQNIYNELKGGIRRHRNYQYISELTTYTWDNVKDYAAFEANKELIKMEWGKIENERNILDQTRREVEEERTSLDETFTTKLNEEKEKYKSQLEKVKEDFYQKVEVEVAKRIEELKPEFEQQWINELYQRQQHIINERVNKLLQSEIKATLSRKDETAQEEIKLNNIKARKAIEKIESEYNSLIEKMEKRHIKEKETLNAKIQYLDTQIKETIIKYETLFEKKYKDEIEARAKELAKDYLKKEFPFE